MCFLLLGVPYVFAQTLGTAPQLNRAVQGQTGAQPEGAFFNFINWVGNVVAPVGAGGAVFGGIVSYIAGTDLARILDAIKGQAQELRDAFSKELISLLRSVEIREVIRWTHLNRNDRAKYRSAAHS